MDDNTIIEQLEELAERFRIQIRYEPIKQDEDLVRVVGGLCLYDPIKDLEPKKAGIYERWGKKVYARRGQ
jgi:hypothetical protein